MQHYIQKNPKCAKHVNTLIVIHCHMLSVIVTLLNFNIQITLLVPFIWKKKELWRYHNLPSNWGILKTRQYNQTAEMPWCRGPHALLIWPHWISFHMGLCKEHLYANHQQYKWLEGVKPCHSHTMKYLEGTGIASGEISREQWSTHRSLLILS